MELFGELDGFVYQQIKARLKPSRLALQRLHGLVLLSSYLQLAGRPDVGAGPATDFDPYARAIRPSLQNRRKR